MPLAHSDRPSRGPAAAPAGDANANPDAARDAARFATLADAQRAIIAAGPDLAAVMEAAARHAVALAGADGATVETPDGDAVVYRAAAGITAGRADARLAVASSLTGACLRTGQALHCVDTETDARVDRATCRLLGVRSMAVAPLGFRGRVVGVLKVVASRPHAFAPRDLEALGLLASLTAAALSRGSASNARRALAAAERAATAAAVHEIEERLRSAFHDAPAGIAMVGLDGRVLDANAALARLLRVPLDRLVGSPFASFVHADDREADAAWRRAVADGAVAEPVERRLEGADGATIWALVSASIVHNTHEVPVHLVVHVQDVSAQRQVEARLIQAERLASVGLVAAGVAHELNNPLAFVGANVQYVREELARLVDDPATDAAVASALAGLTEALTDAEMGAARLEAIVKDLRLLSRSDESLAPVDVRRVMDAAVKIASGVVTPRARLVRADGPVPLVLATEARLGQVFLNLLVNAAQALDAGDPGRENEIRVATMTDPQGRAVVEVRDNGPGIPPAMQARIFEPFFTTKGPVEGTGLGLSICRGIVVRLGGSITVESEVGAGTVFRVTLPPVTGD